MSTQHPDYTEDDYNIVSLGYWDPGADEEDAAPSALEEPVGEEEIAEQGAADEVTPESEKDAEDSAVEETEPESEAGTEQGSPEPNPWSDSWDGAEEETPDIARVELAPGGVKSAVEAILAVAQQPVTVRELSATLIISEHTVEVALDQLFREYNGYDDGQRVHEPRGFELRRVAGGWRLYARADFAPWVSQHMKAQQSAKLPKSAMETLSVIAYQQPITKGHVAAIRGANSDAAFRTLLLHGLIAEAGADEEGLMNYSTTPEFLERMGLNSLDELPPLAPYLPDVEDVPLLSEQP